MSTNLHYVLRSLEAIQSRQCATDDGLFAQLHTAGYEHEGIQPSDITRPRWWWLGPLDSATRYDAGQFESNR
jgi:hypothetical protein